MPKNTLIRLMPFLSLALMLGMPPQAALADDFPKLNQIYQSFSADLNGDGQAENVVLRAALVDDEGYTGQLQVRDAAGKVLWQGPVPKSAKGAFDPKLPIFGAWPFGISNISLVYDLGHDGVVDLMSPEPQSDVRPVTWRLFSWKNAAFVYMASGRLIETKPGSGQFDWGDPGKEGKTWINKLAQKGQDLIAEIYVSQSGGGMLGGQAKMQVNQEGLKVSSWIKKPAKLW